MQALLDADLKRRTAMIEGDAETLDNLLHKDLTWTHSSGRTDNKESFLAMIREANTVYKDINLVESNSLHHDNAYVLSGLFEGNAIVNGTPKALKNKFLSVWVETDNGLQMLAWQSTGV